VSNERQSVLAQRLAAAAEEQPDPAPKAPPAPASPPPAAAPAPVPSQAPAPAAEDDDDARDRFTFYLDKELGEAVEERAHNLFYDARGALTKGDIYSAVIAAGLDRWDEVHRELWARTKQGNR
jgi:hypothetical protein